MIKVSSFVAILALSAPLQYVQAADLSSTVTSSLQLSGIYPHLAFYNDENECGTGAVVPWAGALWAVTYAPHKPEGSTDKLYEIRSADGTDVPAFSGQTSPALTQIIRPESIGGTPANRMIHRESQQLFIGPYAIDKEGDVRAIPYSEMYGRPTGIARHLFDPANKIYYATMEEGLYEVDVHSLDVKELWRDEQVDGGRKSDLPGYHGKGLYSGQGLLVYANNGDHSRLARKDPRTTSGVLATWDGRATSWTIVRRNQFTEVTGPGGIYGNENSAEDPIWTVGWDHKSLILMSLEDRQWNSWRLPKASHSYDGAHGWNTEWPRIRDVGEDSLLMTMHGTFWKFPKTFSTENTAGIRPRSNYIKVIGDFTRWGDRIVFGCDDTARAEFLNKRRAKGKIALPQSQSNVWFVDPAQLDNIGPAIGRGAVWLNEPVEAGQVSDPYLFAGYEKRGAFFSVGDDDHDVDFTLETDRSGDGNWTSLTTVQVAPGGSVFHEFDPAEAGEWIRVKSLSDSTSASVVFGYRNDDTRTTDADPIFDGLAEAGESKVTGGLVRAMANNTRSLAFAAIDAAGESVGYYEMEHDLKLKRLDEPAALEYQVKSTPMPADVLTLDEASVLFVDDNDNRWRLPRGSDAYNSGGTFGIYRVDREVATERDMFNAAGIFYELPAKNAGGFAGVRPIATHNRMVFDYCSYAGLLVMSGVVDDADGDNPHIIKSDDGRTALWVGAVDDVWKMGKARGVGGPWKDTAVKAGVSSDPYLMTGFDVRRLNLSADKQATLTAEIDITGHGKWVSWKEFNVEAGSDVDYQFPDSLEAYWIRFTSNVDCMATAQLQYD